MYNCLVTFEKQCDVLHVADELADTCVFSSTMGQVYAEHRDEDGFLYVAYSGENTFGRCGTTRQRLLTVTAADNDDGHI